MGSTSLTAAEVMDLSASLMNDSARTVYTYAAQMPYLNMALAELEEHFQLNNIPVTDETSVTITIPAGSTEINAFDGVGSGLGPTYPQDLVEIQSIHEMVAGTNNPSGSLNWIWEGQKIKVSESTLVREIRLDYIKAIFPKVTNHAAVIGVINAKTFLFFRTAALCSEFIGENETRAAKCNSFAELAIDRVTGIGTKAKQSRTTRRKPLRASYKRRSM
jgi:hypothetical protein